MNDYVEEAGCGNCKWHKNYTGEWVCMNTLSDMYGIETDLEDYCDDYEEREKL